MTGEQLMSATPALAAAASLSFLPLGSCETVPLPFEPFQTAVAYATRHTAQSPRRTGSGGARCVNNHFGRTATFRVPPQFEAMKRSTGLKRKCTRGEAGVGCGVCVFDSPETYMRPPCTVPACP
ncbi:hypothetical protein EYF80_042665 [Liparis tanakae]|uniref:Secreted protein n=1 Tax=Liparis tanakae TaxID=230148 RepID=A0A4Z2G1L4_9TELE|nr:hypothetical protein EYF80_042665 [Liparis tanakae]